MRKIVLLVAALIAFGGCGVQKRELPVTPDAAVKSIIASYPELRGATIGISFRDMDGWASGSNGDKRMIPASNLKLITTGVALHRLGPDYTFKTKIGYAGTIRDGVLYGDLYIIGGGDPTIGANDSAAFPVDSVFFKWYSLLKNAGITNIEGQVVGDGRAWEGRIESSDWAVGDLTMYYAAGSSALSFNKNAIDVDGIRDHMLADKKGEFSCAKAFRNYLVGKGFEAGGPIGYLGPEGLISLFGEPAQTLTILGEVESPSLKDIVRETLLESDNFYAEAIFRAIAEEATGNADYATATATLNDILTELGLDSSDTRIVDGSGLARRNSVSPAFMTQFLCAMASDSVFVQSIPHPGEGTRTLALKDSPNAKSYRLKSGSMGGILCYSGYILNDQGEPIKAVSVMINGSTATKEELLPAMEALLELSNRFIPGFICVEVI